VQLVGKAFCDLGDQPGLDRWQLDEQPERHQK
jgi:hypothetical protein